MISYTRGPMTKRTGMWAPWLLLFAIMVAQPDKAEAQWVANGNNINNTNSGNVGIGTTTPASKLDVIGNIALSPNSRITSTFDWGNYFMPYESGTGRMALRTAGVDRVSILSSGNVGIGTISPTSRLHIREDPVNAATDKAGSYFFLESNNSTGAAINNTHSVLSVEGSTNSGYGWAGQIGVKSVVGPYWGPITDARAFYAKGRTRLNYHGITNYSGYYVDTPTAVTNSSIANAYGLYVALQKTTNITNGYGVYQAGAADINYFSGNVGIGTATPSAKLHVTGTATVTGGTSTGALTVNGAITSGTINVTGDLTVTGNIAAKYQDVAEWVPARHALSPATVVVLDAEHSNLVLASWQAYDTRVAGVVSASPGVILGESGEGKVMVATTGRVKVRVEATRVPIRVGDLLVTSDKEGIAMRSEPLSLGGTPIHRPGTLIGKALEPLEKGVGEILVLLSLQ